MFMSDLRIQLTFQVLNFLCVTLPANDQLLIINNQSWQGMGKFQIFHVLQSIQNNLFGTNWTLNGRYISLGNWWITETGMLVSEQFRILVGATNPNHSNITLTLCLLLPLYQSLSINYAILHTSIQELLQSFIPLYLTM